MGWLPNDCSDLPTHSCGFTFWASLNRHDVLWMYRRSHSAHAQPQAEVPLLRHDAGPSGGGEVWPAGSGGVGSDSTSSSGTSAGHPIHRCQTCYWTGTLKSDPGWSGSCSCDLLPVLCNTCLSVIHCHGLSLPIFRIEWKRCRNFSLSDGKTMRSSHVFLRI